MKILKIEGDKAIVVTGQIRRSISLGILDKAGVGDYVIVHAGFAIERIDPGKAEETLEMLRNIR